MTDPTKPNAQGSQPEEKNGPTPAPEQPGQDLVQANIGSALVPARERTLALVQSQTREGQKAAMRNVVEELTRERERFSRWLSDSMGEKIQRDGVPATIQMILEANDASRVFVRRRSDQQKRLLGVRDDVSNLYQRLKLGGKSAGALAHIDTALNLSADQMGAVLDLVDNVKAGLVEKTGEMDDRMVMTQAILGLNFDNIPGLKSFFKKRAAQDQVTMLLVMPDAWEGQEQSVFSIELRQFQSDLERHLLGEFQKEAGADADQTEARHLAVTSAGAIAELVLHIREKGVTPFSTEALLALFGRRLEPAEVEEMRADPKAYFQFHSTTKEGSKGYALIEAINRAATAHVEGNPRTMAEDDPRWGELFAMAPVTDRVYVQRAEDLLAFAEAMVPGMKLVANATVKGKKVNVTLHGLPNEFVYVESSHGAWNGKRVQAKSATAKNILNDILRSLEPDFAVQFNQPAEWARIKKTLDDSSATV